MKHLPAVHPPELLEVICPIEELLLDINSGSILGKIVAGCRLEYTKPEFARLDPSEVLDCFASDPACDFGYRPAPSRYSTDRLQAMHLVDCERSLKIFYAEQSLVAHAKEFEAEQDAITERLTPLRGYGRLIKDNGSHGYHHVLKPHVVTHIFGVHAWNGFTDPRIALLYKGQHLDLKRLLRARRWR